MRIFCSWLLNDDGSAVTNKDRMVRDVSKSMSEQPGNFPRAQRRLGQWKFKQFLRTERKAETHGQMTSIDMDFDFDLNNDLG